MLAALLLTAASVAPGLTLGEVPPPLNLEHVLPPGSPSTWEALRGKPVVVEFWATWCDPCVHEIPHLNELAARFKDVQFISITDEPLSAVEPFLARRPVAGIVVLDRNQSTFSSFGITGRPQTLLLDKDGVLRAILLPRQVTNAVLADLIAGRPLSVERLPIHSMIFENAVRDPLFAAVVRPAEPGKVGGIVRIVPGLLEIENLELRSIIGHAHSIHGSRVEGPKDLLAARYDMCVLLPQGRDDGFSTLRDMLERAFKLEVRRETRSVDVLVLTAGKAKLQESSKGGHTMPHLARLLEYQLKKFVVDETGLAQAYDFDYPPRNAGLEAFAREQLGLELTPAKRPVEILVIESAETPRFRTAVSNTIPVR